MPAEAITDDKASAEYGNHVEAWGKRGWSLVGSTCRWAVAHGMTLPFTCPPAS